MTNSSANGKSHQEEPERSPSSLRENDDHNDVEAPLQTEPSSEQIASATPKSVASPSSKKSEGKESASAPKDPHGKKDVPGDEGATAPVPAVKARSEPRNGTTPSADSDWKQPGIDSDTVGATAGKQTRTKGEKKKAALDDSSVSGISSEGGSMGSDDSHNLILQKTKLARPGKMGSIDEVPLPPPALQPGRNYSRPGAIRMSVSGGISDEDDDVNLNIDEERSPSIDSSPPPPPSLSPTPTPSAEAFVVEASLVDETTLSPAVISAPVEMSRHDSMSPPTDDGTQDVEVVEAQRVDDKPIWKNRTFQLGAILLILLVAGAGAGIAVGVTQSGGNASPEPGSTMAPSTELQGLRGVSPTITPQVLQSPIPTQLPSTLMPTAAPSQSPSISPAPTFSPTVFVPMIDRVRLALPDYTLAALADSSSPQSIALAWMGADPELETYSLSRAEQRFALVTLFVALDGSNWKNNDKWASFSDECTWFTNSLADLPACVGGDYYNLALLNNRLRGTIPLEIGILSSLKSIELDRNPLVVGELPYTIGDILGLEFLIAYETQLAGEFPSFILDLPFMTYVDLEFNSFTGGLPTRLGALVRLEDLYLSGNTFTGTVPSELGTLPELEGLWLADNNLEGSIPSSFASLTNMLDFDVAANSFNNSFFEENIVNDWLFLTDLDIGDNFFQGRLTSDIARLDRLTYLDLYYNEFRGPLPTELGLLTNAEVLYFETNNFRGTIPSELGNLSNLQILHLYENRFEGSVPAELCTLIQTNDLDLAIDCDLVACDCGCSCNATARRTR